MLKVLQREDWVAQIEKTRPLMLNEEQNVVNVLCQGGDLTPVYFLYQKKDKILISYIALTKRKEIKHPFHFFYSAFWVDENFSDTQFCQFLDEFVKELLTIYKKIDIKLPVGLADIRPFLWCGFSVVNYYTYLKNLADLSYHPITAKNIRKAQKEDYECKQEELNQESLKLNLQIFKDLKAYSSAKIDAIGALILVMKDGGFVTSFNCYRNKTLIASNVVFLDAKNKIAYTVLLNKIPRSNRDDVHSLLHDFFFTKLKADGFEYVDLLGGDMQGIAPFKSRFNTALRPHFLVRYDKKMALFSTVVSSSKQFAKKLLAKLS